MEIPSARNTIPLFLSRLMPANIDATSIFPGVFGPGFVSGFSGRGMVWNVHSNVRTGCCTPVYNQAGHRTIPILRLPGSTNPRKQFPRGRYDRLGYWVTRNPYIHAHFAVLANPATAYRFAHRVQTNGPPPYRKSFILSILPIGNPSAYPSSFPAIKGIVRPDQFSAVGMDGNIPYAGRRGIPSRHQ